MKNIVLASKSPRRRELLCKLDLPYTSYSPNIDESLDNTKDIEESITILAYNKAKDAIKQHSNSIVIAADTIVTIDTIILGKPENTQDAFNMLRLLSGRIHSVMTGVCILSDNKMESFCDISEVEFYPLSDEEIVKYIETKEPMDKAGGYGIQGKGALLVKRIVGDFYSIMGLPIARINQKIDEFLL